MKEIIKRKIAICTFARSEYGLLKRVIGNLSSVADTWLIAGGGHFSSETGFSFHEITADKILPENRILKADFLADHAGAPSVATGIMKVSALLEKQNFDAVMVMGDRYDLFTVTIPALLQGIPIMHISGGEITEGAIDESIRHATTKMAHLHFVANTVYAENVSRMGEEDWRIVITGEPGLDNIHHADIASDEELKADFGIDLHKPTLLVTFHPSTLEPAVSVKDQCTPLAETLRRVHHYQVVITAPGADPGSEIIAGIFSRLATGSKHIRYIPHLGSRNYLAVMRKAAAVVGNSSSGLVEAPSLKIPSVNIGNRQKNRMAAKSVIHCGYGSEEIGKAIREACSESHRELCRYTENPYDPYSDGRNSERVTKAALRFLESISPEQRLIKKFDTRILNTQWNQMLL
jgi:GDP/UDP-N,N'-diacetylbacillosamine 2-epimerase (hydrolysing)